MARESERQSGFYRSPEPRVHISVTLLKSERDELDMWAREAGVSMSKYLQWMVQDESVQRFLSIKAVS